MISCQERGGCWTTLVNVSDWRSWIPEFQQVRKPTSREGKGGRRDGMSCSKMSPSHASVKHRLAFFWSIDRSQSPDAVFASWFEGKQRCQWINSWVMERIHCLKWRHSKSASTLSIFQASWENRDIGKSTPPWCMFKVLFEVKDVNSHLWWLDQRGGDAQSTTTL